MKIGKRNLVLVIALLFVSFSSSAQQKNHKAIFVIVDGIPADVVEKVSTPALDSIAKVGAFLYAHVGGEKGGYSETPTISAVGYNSLLTGTWVNKHNVWDNDIKDPNYSYPTIFLLTEKQDPSKKTAIFSSWLDNRTKLVGEGLEATGKVQLDHHYDGLELDTLTYPHDPDTYYMHLIDESVVQHARDYIKSDGPDLTWVYLEYTDDMGHRYGDSEKFYNAVQMMDKQMGQLWDAIRYREKNFKEKWQIYITTDHGRDSATGKHHGGQSTRERNTWIVTNASNINPYFKNNRAAVVDIMPSIASFIGVKIPREVLMEIDGVSLTGKLSATSPQATLSNNRITVSWKAMEKKGNAKIWLATTNNYKQGGKDEYKLVKTVPVSKEKVEIDVSKLQSEFYKVVIETQDNFLNRWIIE